MPTFTYNNTFTNFLVTTIPTFKYSDTMTISSVNYVYFHLQQHSHKFPAISSLSRRTITAIPAIGSSGCYLSTIFSFLLYLLSLAELSPLFRVLALPVPISVPSLVFCYVLLFVEELSPLFLLLALPVAVQQFYHFFCSHSQQHLQFSDIKCTSSHHQQFRAVSYACFYQKLYHQLPLANRSCCYH